MKQWQQDYIRENLTTLVRDTQCDPLLMACLVNAKVFGDADIAKLKSMTNSHEQAYELYERAQTRTDAYPKLINALHAAGQNGIVEILQYGYVKNELPVPEIPLPVAPGRVAAVVTPSPIGDQGHHAAGPTNQNFSPPKEVVDSAKEEMESAAFSGKRRRN